MKDIKVAIIAIAKQEDSYINEFIDYYSDLGVDKLFIVDNNEYSYKPTLYDVIKNNNNIDKVCIENQVGIQFIQIQSYMRIYEREKSNYDWFIIVDIDEHIKLNNKYKNIKQFLLDPIFNNFNSIIIPWIIYDDNDNLYYEDNLLEKRFTRPFNLKYENFKSAYRGNLNIDISLHTGHSKKDIIKQCNPNGMPNPITLYYKNNKRYYRYNYQYQTENDIYIKHFRFKTIQEYILTKIKRGRPCVKERNYWLNNKSDKQLLDIFFTFNIKTKEKEEYGLKLLKQLRDSITNECCNNMCGKM